MASGLLSSFLAAIQASLSVLLVISYGALAAHLHLLNSSNCKAISKICVKMFLPALLLVKIGSELHPGSAHRYLLILCWAFVAHFISFLIGISAHLLFGMPDWITAALMFNNTTSYPLLLIQSLDETGILSRLVVNEGEGTREAIERAKSYFLVFATVSSCLTFAVGPRLVDSEHAPESDSEDSKSLVGQGEGVEEERARNGDIVNEETGLLSPEVGRRERMASVTSMTFFPSKPKFTTLPHERRPWKTFIPLMRWRDLSERTQWWLLFLYDFLNAPLAGAVLGAIVGLTTPLHTAFFSDTYEGGIFTAWLTASWKNIGSLFVPLPLVVAGISLYTSYQDSKASSPSEDVRFVIWPIVSIAVIYGLAREGFLGEDPMLWFAMMLMPTGPPAMKLITMVQVSDAGAEDERKIAKILTVSYVISPVLAFTVVGSLKASETVVGR
ncbi:hypothetical protein GQ43DRAFT_463365 [Delitschia confertaspora ATCC 74209]|uniref:Auxin efflux carrier n=1 Tax=Delitschia confertaspora ATCC 74209 TaxID=1513339 RepID=A0A9P4JKT2_9PLEO|nr:hypothetical protein GQ43DRAFT_463365 [Delitschia confertaspora ATCC 74209]